MPRAKRYLRVERPDLFAQIDREATEKANPGIDIDELTVGSEKYKIYWTCEKHPEYPCSMIILNKMKKDGCSVCSGRQVIPEYNSLQILNASLASEWGSNNTKKPTEVTIRSMYKAQWVCKVNPKHQWKATVDGRTSGTGCPYCSGSKVYIGENDLSTLNPTLANQWHPTKNNLPPTEVSVGSTYKAWWLCENSHEWLATVVDRHNKSYGCPFCTGRKVLAGYNDLTSKRPELASEWHPTKNDRTTSQVTLGSSYSAWWKCAAGHEWEAAVYQRKNSGCPRCCCSGISKLEYRLIECLNEIPELQVTAHSLQSIYKWGRSRRKMEIDIVVMNTKTLNSVFIEVDGEFFHRKKRDMDTEKTLAMLTSSDCTGVVRIRTDGLFHLDIEHDRLLQIDYQYSLKDEGLHDVAQQIREFINSGNLGEPVVWCSDDVDAILKD